MNETSIITLSGNVIDYSDLENNNYTIEDIARGLARECRYIGQINREHYSVAEHCVLMAEYVLRLYGPQKGAELAYDCLMHDATEAYLKDVPAPLKTVLRGYRALEWELMDILAERFHFNKPNDEIKIIDKTIQTNETQILQGRGFENASLSFVNIKCWSPNKAEEEFLREYALLKELIRNNLSQKAA